MTCIRSKFLHPFPIAIIGVMLLGVVALAISVFAFRTDGERKVEQEMNELQRLGFFVTQESFLADYNDVRWKPGENAALELEKAFPLIQTSKEAWAELPDGYDWNEPEEVEAVRAFLEKNADALELFHRASHRSYQRFPLDFTSERMPRHLDSLREGGRLLRLEAAFRLHESSPDLAVESIRTIFRLSLLLAHQPNFWSQFATLSFRRHGVLALADVFERTTLSQDQLWDLQRLLEIVEQEPVLKSAFQGEILVSETEFRERFQGMSWMYIIHARTGLYLRDQALYLSQLSALFSARYDYDRLVALEKAYDDVTFGFGDLGRSQIFGFHTVTLIFTQSCFRAMAYNRILRILVAMELFHHEQGQLPEEIVELTPKYIEALPDPFAGKEFSLYLELADPFAGKEFSLYLDEEFLVVESAGLTGRKGEEKNISLRLPLSRD